MKLKNIRQWGKLLFIPVIITVTLTSCSTASTSTATTKATSVPATASVTTSQNSIVTPTAVPTTPLTTQTASTVISTATSLAVSSTTAAAPTSSTTKSTSSSPNQPPPGNSPQPSIPGSGTSSTVVEGTGAYTQSANSVTKSSETFTATDTDESAIKVTNSGVLTIKDSSITISGYTSSMDSASFYGLNAAVLAESGSQITLSNSTITTTGTGANGAFATGSGSSIVLSDVTINCTATGAHGVDATNAGSLTLTNVDITTAGDGASAAIATDRGSGTITVTGGTVTTSGTKSPCIYSTGEITVNGGTMTATGSEAVAIEGKNSVTLNDTTISSAKSWGVIIYQSMSGDASVGTGNFTMNGGSLTAAEGPLFYITNTDAVIMLKDATLSAASGTLLKASAGDWGTTGSNGGIVTFTADNETLKGDILCDKISTVTMELKNGTTFMGAINADNTAKSISLTLDKTSVWNVIGTSYITILSDADATLANIKDNGNTIYYDATASANSWLNGKTITLADGGILTPG